MLVERSDLNPVLKPENSHPWEALAAFNGCPVARDGSVDLVYRAISLDRHSTIGVATSKDGLNFHDRKQLVVPQEKWDSSGCEDPRVTHLDGRFFVLYTAISGRPPGPNDIKVGVAVTKDLRKVDERHLVTHFNSKAMALFPERIAGKLWAMLSVHTDMPPTKICLASFDKVEDMWERAYWEEWYRDFDKKSLPLVRASEDHVEVGAPPVKTDAGWLVFYSYIQGYFTPDRRLFTVEAVLLDLDDPMKVVGRTTYPLLTPEEYYERMGGVSDVVFPSGALLGMNRSVVNLYYGAADTVCCTASVDLHTLVTRLSRRSEAPMFVRANENPVISPARPWESKGTFNPGAILLDDGKVHILYRAVAEDNVSALGYARSAKGDGVHIEFRSQDPAYAPREDFEVKRADGNSGCEDPRLTLLGDRIYMCYTGLDGKSLPRVALTSIGVKDFKEMRWDSWAKSVLISPPDMDDKDACLFPEKVKDPGTGKEQYLVIHRLGSSIDYAFVPDLEFGDGMEWLEEHMWIRPRRGFWDSVKVGLAAPPIKTGSGWILLYHGVDEKKVYRVGAVLLRLENPLHVVSRTDEPLFEPEAPYEKEGVVSNVVFPCGAVTLDDGRRTYIYYGAGDKVTGVASLETEKILKPLMA